MNHSSITTPATLKNAYAHQTTGRKFEALLSLVMLLACLGFWYWLVLQPQFALGIVDTVNPVGHERAVAQLNNPAKTDFIFEYEDILQSLQGQWVFAHGERVGDSEPQILYPDQIESIQMFLQLVVLPVKSWITEVGKSKYLAILLAGLLLLISGHAFRYAYSLAITTFVCFSAWHGMHVSKWLELFSFDLIGLIGVLLLCAVISLRWSVTHSRFSFVESLMAMLVWVATGHTVLAGFGVESELWQLMVFGLALVCPSIVSALLAAFLLSQAFEASHLGALILLAICILVSLTQIVGTQTARYHVYQLVAQTKSRLLKSKRPWPKGRVTLHEFLNTHS